jgi:hypothetical protein
LVIIPHSVIHGLPLHLVHTDSGEPLCTVTGVTYASSLSEFVRCASSNPARSADSITEPFTFKANASTKRVGGYCADVLDGPETEFNVVTAGIESGLGHSLTAVGSRNQLKASIDVRRGRAFDAFAIMAHGFLDPYDHQLSGLLLSSRNVLDDRYLDATYSPMAVPAAQQLLRYRADPVCLPPAELEISRHAELMTIAELRSDTLSNVPLMVLFGCSAGWSRVVKGDIPSSFGQTLLTLGSSTVIAPAWDADVKITARWAALFFEAWSRFQWPAALGAAYATRTLYDDSIPMEHYGAIVLRGDWL